jgi:hypothetical protein
MNRGTNTSKLKNLEIDQNIPNALLNRRKIF